MKKSDELKQKRTALEGEIDKLVSKETRSAEENKELKTKHGELESLNDEISLEEKNEQFAVNRARQHGRKISDKEAKDLSKFSFAKFIKMAVDAREGKPMEGLEGEMHQEGVRELKATGKEARGFVIPEIVINPDVRANTGQNVGTDADGGYLVQDMPFKFVEALKNKLVLTQLGATFLPGLTGNLPLLRGGSFSASWIAEGSNVSFTKEAFSKATMQPHNLAVAGALSKQVMVQTAGVAETIVRNDLLNAMAHGLQDAAINGSGSGATPTGILNYAGIGSVAGGTNGLAPAWSHIVDLESAVANENAEFMSGGYLTNTKVRGILKQTLKASGVAGYIWDGQGMNGAPAKVTNAVPDDLDKGTSTGVCSAIIYGFFSELFIGLWGGMDIVVDPYTRADYNELKIVIHQFADVALRNPKSFAAMKDALTS